MKPFLGPGCGEAPLEAARALILPVPYEATTSYGRGTRDGPRAILEASWQVETFDYEYGSEICKRVPIHTLPPLEDLDCDPAAAVAAIAECVAEYTADRRRLLVALGGEHALSPGVVRGLCRSHGELFVVCFDAHCDLRDQWEGQRYSHACAMRRMLEENVAGAVQIGVRNFSAEGHRFLKQAKNLLAFTAEVCRENWEEVGAETVAHAREADRPVYLSVDLDAFDPAFVPATGTPEPDGLSWAQVDGLIRALGLHCSLIGADLVELAPLAGQPASDFFAAKLGYRIIAHACLGAA